MKRKIMAAITSIAVIACLVVVTMKLGPKDKQKKQNDIAQSEDKEIIDPEDVPLDDSFGVAIQQTEADIRVMPDKYNTGASGSLTPIKFGDTVNGVMFTTSGASDRYVLDFQYRNKQCEGTYVIENIDFSAYRLDMYHESGVNRDITVIFKNCLFDSVNTCRIDSRVKYEFEQCTMKQFYGSNSTLKRCRLGGSFRDGLVPFRNVTVQDCFFADLTSEATTAGKHSDGTQIYGYADAEVYDVTYQNCRFEVPALIVPNSNASVNACLMFQIEYNNASNVSFLDCTINGGGYSIYAAKCKGDWALNNIVFQNISFGCAKKFGPIHPNIAPEVVIDNLHGTDSLYVGSVWKEDGKTYLSVTNDTDIPRTFVVKTGTQTYTYQIPACTPGDRFTTGMTYSDFPFDVLITVPEDADYVVAYDAMSNKQIRFVNWTGNPVKTVGDVSELAIVEVGSPVESEVLTTGLCGKNVTYTLTADGVMVLSGSGATSGYNSAKLPPYSDYMSYIKKVIVEEGITELGGMLFRGCTNLTEVVLPDGLVSIGGNVFHKCSSLYKVYLPSSLTSIGKYAFSGTVLSEVHYSDNQDLFDKIEMGVQNDIFKRAVLIVE